jgi:hypothetical protein
MAWFNSTADLKFYVGKEIDAATSFTSFSPLVAMAENRYYYRRHLSRNFWTEVNDIVPNGDITLADINKAKDIYKQSIAWFVLALYAESSIRLDENGLSRTESDTKKSAYKYQEVNARRMYEQRGFDALDEFYIHLETIGIFYWGNQAESEEYNPLMGTIIKSAKDFARAANRNIDRRTFESLSGLMYDVEESMMRQFLPKMYYDFLYEAVLDGSLSVLDTSFTPILKKAIAACTLKLAGEQNAVRFEGDRVYLVETYTDGAMESQKYDPAAVGMNRMFQEVQQNTYLRRARQFAIENKSQMPKIWSADDGGDNTDADAWTLISAPVINTPEYVCSTTEITRGTASTPKIFLL